MRYEVKATKAQVKKIVSATYPRYTGRKFRIVFTDTLAIYNTNWCEGSRTEYTAIRGDGQIDRFNAPAPWVNMIEGTTIQMPDDAIIVTHSIFCGQDMGITIYAHTCHMNKMTARLAAGN